MRKTASRDEGLRVRLPADVRAVVRLRIDYRVPSWRMRDADGVWWRRGQQRNLQV